MVPGILYSPLAKRARIQGTGLEVWEIARAYDSVDRNFARLAASFDWLTSEQLRAAPHAVRPDSVAIRAPACASPARHGHASA